MPPPNFCVKCGQAIAHRRWRAWRSQFCASCAARYGKQRAGRLAITGLIVLTIGFTTGRYLRPSPPPLTIERRADSPLSDLPVSPTNPAKPGRNSRIAESDSAGSARVAAGTDDPVYLCGARTQKGTPCRRRVHVAGDRCYQHKGKPAMLPVEKLKVENGR